MSNEPRESEPPRWIWLYGPFAILVVQVITRVAGDEAYGRWMRGEVSVPELGTVALLLIAIAFAIALLRRRATLPNRLLVPWIALMALGCFLFAGEEASWGQSYVHWRTPETLAAANAQQETNLHNLKAIRPLVDNLPRAVLTLGAIIAVAVPLLRRWKPERFRRDARFGWLLPTYVCLPAALLALFVRNLEGLAKLAGDPLRNLFDMQAGEFKEYFLAYLLMVYVMSLAWRTRAPAPR